MKHIPSFDNFLNEESKESIQESNNWGTYNTAEGAAVAKELNKAYDKLTSDVEKAFDAYKKAVKVYTNGPKKELGNKSGFNDSEGEHAITWGIKDMLTKIFKVDTRNMYYDAFWMFEGELYDVKKDIKAGKMHKLLGVPEDKEITDVYKDPKKLAEDLVKATGDKKEATGMLAFAANINPKDNIFDKALKAMPEVK